MSNIAVVLGSYDPITKGHLDIIERATNIFDEVHVLVAVNLEKMTWFTPEERVEMIQGAIASEDYNHRVIIAQHEGLTVDYCSNINANIIVRGLRSAADFDYEVMISNINVRLNYTIDTIFLPCSPDLTYVSSSAVKELAMMEKILGDMVPRNVRRELEIKVKDIKRINNLRG